MHPFINLGWLWFVLICFWVLCQVLGSLPRSSSQGLCSHHFCPSTYFYCMLCSQAGITATTPQSVHLGRVYPPRCFPTLGLGRHSTTLLQVFCPFLHLTEMLWYLEQHKWAGRYSDGISLVLLPHIFCQYYVQHSTGSFYQNPGENTHYIKKGQRGGGILDSDT